MIPSAGAGFVYACANYTYPRTLACPRLKDRPSKFNLDEHQRPHCTSVTTRWPRWSVMITTIPKPFSATDISTG
jgi:hypothetical protein